MYKDKHGNHLTLHTVVVNSLGDVYTITGVNKSMENLLTLRNGCIVCQDKPENLEVLVRIK